jgi:hypothetical protein
MTEHCNDCGEEHDTVEEVVKKLKRKSRLFLVGYLFSLAIMAFCLFKLFGPYGGLGVVAGFGIYITHLNMVTYSETLGAVSQLRTAHQIKQELRGGGEPQEPEAGSGQYL